LDVPGSKAATSCNNASRELGVLNERNTIIGMKAAEALGRYKLHKVVCGLQQRRTAR
jgi:hypothetical protein